MPSPSSSLATLRPDLAQSFEEFDLMMDAQGFIAMNICPVADVASASGNFGRIPVEQLLQSPDLARSPGSGYNRGKFTFVPDTYATQERGYEEPIDDNEANMYANYFSAEQVSAARAMSALMRGYESRVAGLYFGTGNFTNQAVAAKWNDPGNAVPITDVETAIQAVYAASGLWPNVMVINRKVARNLRHVDQIVNLIKYSGRDDPKASGINPSVLAELFNIEEVLVAGATKNTANQGQAAALAQIWSDSYAFIGHVARGQDFKQPTVARTFHWGSDGSTIGGTFETYRDETIRSDVVRVRHQTQEKLLYPEAGILLTGVTA